MDSLKLENQLCFPLYAASREIVKLYAPFLEEIGLTYTQYVVMLVLWERKEVTAKELGTLLFLDSGTITPVVKKLEKLELVTRHRGVDDERTLVISLTSCGEALRENALNIPERMAKCVNLDAEEGRILYALLYKILAGKP